MAVDCSATLLIKDSNGLFVPAREVKHGDQTFVVAKPGQQFKVRVEAKGLAADRHMLATCTIDGNWVGFAYALSPSAATRTFDGWYAGAGVYTELVFAPARDEGHTSVKHDSDESQKGSCCSPAADHLGKIEVTFALKRKEVCPLVEYNADTGNLKKGDPPHCRHCASYGEWFNGQGVSQAKGVSSHNSSTPKGSEVNDKKFYMKPSLRATSSGNVSNKTASFGSSHLADVPGVPAVVVTLQCEVEDFLVLRHILPPQVDTSGRNTDSGARGRKPEAGGAGSTGKEGEGAGDKAPNPGSKAPKAQFPGEEGDKARKPEIPGKAGEAGVGGEHGRGSSREDAITLDDEEEGEEEKENRRPLPVGSNRSRSRHPLQEPPKVKVYDASGHRGRRPCRLSGEGSPIFVWEEEKDIETVELDD